MPDRGPTAKWETLDLEVGERFLELLVIAFLYRQVSDPTPHFLDKRTTAPPGHGRLGLDMHLAVALSAAQSRALVTQEEQHKVELLLIFGSRLLQTATLILRSRQELKPPQSSRPLTPLRGL